jgi:hypothetical protein
MGRTTLYPTFQYSIIPRRWLLSSIFLPADPLVNMENLGSAKILAIA